MKFLIGLILGVLLVPISLFFYIRSGSAPTAATDAPMPFEKFIARGGPMVTKFHSLTVRFIETFKLKAC